jgi:hypothetical protein
MSVDLFVDVKVKLRFGETGLESMVSTPYDDSEWLPVRDSRTTLSKALSMLSVSNTKVKQLQIKRDLMEDFVGSVGDPRFDLLSSTQTKANEIYRSLRIILEPSDLQSSELRRIVYEMPAELWLYSQSEMILFRDIGHFPFAVVRQVYQNQVNPPVTSNEWRVAWLGGRDSIDTLRQTMNCFWKRGLKFVGAWPLSHGQDLRQALQESRPNIAWLIGEGDPGGNNFLLDGYGSLNFDELCSAFEGIDSLQILFVHSCHIGNLSRGLAENLIRRAGIPMVVTWETEAYSADGLVWKEAVHQLAEDFFDFFTIQNLPAESVLAYARMRLSNPVNSFSGSPHICPLAFKASSAGEIRLPVPIPPDLRLQEKPLMDQRRTVPQKLELRTTQDDVALFVQAFLQERTDKINDLEESIRIYERLRESNDKNVSGVASIRLQYATDRIQTIRQRFQGL